MTSSNVHEGSAVAAVDNRHMISAIVASVLGWSLDLFDLFILLYVAPVVGALFFPSSQQTLSLAATYASFAVTLLMRPVGSAIFGNYADAHGRKNAMTIAVIGVGIVTASFGLLPTIHQAGVVAPILFLVLRLVQGVFVGGVVASTHTIGTESVPLRWRGTMSGLIGGGGAAIGALIASFVYLITSSIFPGAAFSVWGWRCMFLSGLVSAFLGLFIFKNLSESPIWQAAQQEKTAKPASERAPLATLWAGAYRNVLLVNLLITIGGGAGYYLTSGFIPTFLKVINKVPPSTTSLILIAASIAVFVSAVLTGTLSDYIGRKTTFILAGLAGAILLPICYHALAAAHDTTHILLLVLAISFVGNAGYAAVLIFLNERFPTSLRASGTGLSWNIGFAVGGMMPTFVSLASKTPADFPTTLSIFLATLFVIYLIGAFIIPETKGNLR